MTDPRITGRIRYPHDVVVPGMWHVRLVRSPYPSAAVTAVDASAVPGGVVVVGPDDVRGLGRYGCQIADQHVLAAEPRHVGDPVVAVAAPTEALARHAAAMVDVRYDERPAVFDEREALAPSAPLIHARHAVSDSDAAYFSMRPLAGTNVCHRFRIRTDGMPTIDQRPTFDPVPEEIAFAGADVVVDETFHTPAAQHVAMEPHACVAQWHGDELELITGTQTPFNMRQDLARLFGIDEPQVRVICPPMGGSFGAKTFVRTEAIAAAVARAAGRPVRLALDRDEEWVTVTRHAATVRVRLGATREGRFVAKRLWCWVNTGAYADCGPGVAQKMGYAGVGPYRFDHVLVDSFCIYTNMPPAGAYRGYGATQSVWAAERVVDLMADELGLDPLELRRRNVLREGDVWCTGERMHDVAFDELLDRVAAAVDWHGGRAGEGERQRAGGRGPQGEGERQRAGGRGPSGKGIAVMLKGMQTPSRTGVELHRLPDGRVEIRSATVEMGQGAMTALRRLAADLLGVDVARVTFPAPDTARVPYDTRTTSSRSTHMMSRALAAAVDDLGDGDVGCGHVETHGGLDPDTGQGVASSHWHQGAAAAVVDVDETGVVTVKELHAASYAGRVVDRASAELQNEGAMIMALGTALFEEITHEDGQIVGPNLSDSNIPSALDCAAVSHTLLERPGAEVHGLGETAMPPVPPALGNAVASLGYHPTTLPMTPERVLRSRRAPREAAG